VIIPPNILTPYIICSEEAAAKLNRRKRSGGRQRKKAVPGVRSISLSLASSVIFLADNPSGRDNQQVSPPRELWHTTVGAKNCSIEAKAHKASNNIYQGTEQATVFEDTDTWKKS
jgi:hypothetical protein